MTLRALIAFFAALLLWSALGSPVQARAPGGAEEAAVALCSPSDGGTLAQPQESPAQALEPALDGVELLPPSDPAPWPSRVLTRPQPDEAKTLTSVWLAVPM